MPTVYAHPTEYHINDLEFEYNFTRHKGQWSVVRWPANKGRIPPRQTVFTVDGWISVMRADLPEVRKFNGLRAAITIALDIDEPGTRISICEP